MPDEEIFFEDLDLSDDVLDALYDMRFEKCTPVQARCIPPILENRDVLGVAQTGTGKTAAYLLPLLTLLQRHEHPADSVNCLVIAPTRELARQIDQALQGFAYYTRVNAVAVYGGNDGVRYEQERRSLQAGADIVLATPGRLITHLQLGTLDLSRPYARHGLCRRHSVHRQADARRAADHPFFGHHAAQDCRTGAHRDA